MNIIFKFLRLIKLNDHRRRNRRKVDPKSHTQDESQLLEKD